MLRPHFRRRIHELALLVVVATSVACSASADAPDSAEGALSEDASSGLKMLGPGNTPRRVLMPLQVNDRDYALHFYEIVQTINEAERLTGDDAISVVDWVSTEDQMLVAPNPEDPATTFTAKAVIDQLKTKIRTSRRLQTNEPIAGLEIVQTGGNSNFAFLQDIFEMVASAKPGGGTALTMLDLASPAESGDTAGMNQRFRETFGAAPMPADLAPNVRELGDDDDGGNVEVTPEGRPYLGSTATNGLRTAVQKITGQAPVVLPTQWLFVGHVDEYVSFLPSSDECKVALVHADPLEAINIIRKRGDVPLIPKQDLEGDGVTNRDPATAKARFFASLNYFVRPSAAQKETLELADFDLQKPVRDFATIQNFDVELLGNLNAYEEIQKGVTELRRASHCLKQVVPVPLLFARRDGTSGDRSMASDEISGGYTAVAGYLNMVSLRNHVVISKERKEFFGPIVRERLAQIVGSAANVHEIDASYYEEGAGSVHCTSNVIRSLDRWQK
jgi:hypothetical protein